MVYLISHGYGPGAPVVEEYLKTHKQEKPSSYKLNKTPQQNKANFIDYELANLITMGYGPGSPVIREHKQKIKNILNKEEA